MAFGNRGGGFRGMPKYVQSATVQLTPDQVRYLNVLKGQDGSMSDAIRFLIDYGRRERLMRLRVVLPPAPPQPIRYAGWDGSEDA